MRLVLDEGGRKKNKITNWQLSTMKAICSVFGQFVHCTCVSSLFSLLLYKNISPCSYLLIIIRRFTSAPEPAYHGSSAFNKHRSRKVGLFQRRALASGLDRWCSGNAFGALLLLFHQDYITNNHAEAGTALVYFSESVIIAAFKSGFKIPWEQLLCSSCTIRGAEGHRHRWVNEIWWRRQMGSNE